MPISSAVDSSSTEENKSVPVYAVWDFGPMSPFLDSRFDYKLYFKV